MGNNIKTGGHMAKLIIAKNTGQSFIGENNMRTSDTPHSCPQCESYKLLIEQLRHELRWLRSDHRMAITRIADLQRAAVGSYAVAREQLKGWDLIEEIICAKSGAQQDREERQHGRI